MKGKLCSENAWAREGFFGNNWPKMAKITGLCGPSPVYPLSPCRVRAPLKGNFGLQGRSDTPKKDHAGAATYAN